MKTFIAVLLSIFCLQLAVAQLPVFPGAAGWGSTTVAGRGGALYRITNLNDSGPGSLRNAMEATVPRIVVFETSGEIRPLRNLLIENPFITVAGQTAPSPGITIRDASIIVKTHDVLLQHLRIRVGSPRPDGNTSSSDCIEVLTNNQNCYNIFFDHISASWATDENLSVYSPNRTYRAYEIGYWYCLNSEALMTGHINPNHKSDGWLVGSTGGASQEKISIINCIMAFNNARNPTSQSQSLTVANCLIEGWGGKVTLARWENFPTPYGGNFKDNVFIGRSWSRARYLIEMDPNPLPTGSGIYWTGNLVSPPLTLSNGNVPTLSSPRSWPPSYASTPAAFLKERLLIQAGARPSDRDEVDERIMASLSSGTGGLINTQNDVGGWPVLEVVRTTFIDARNPNGDNDRDGYTNREEVLHNWQRYVGQDVPLTSGILYQSPLN